MRVRQSRSDVDDTNVAAFRIADTDATYRQVSVAGAQIQEFMLAHPSVSQRDKPHSQAVMKANISSAVAAKTVVIRCAYSAPPKMLRQDVGEVG